MERNNQPLSDSDQSIRKQNFIFLTENHILQQVLLNLSGDDRDLLQALEGIDNSSLGQNLQKYL